MNAAEIIEVVGFEAALRWHLEHNHYPSVPSSMVPSCALAVVLAGDGEWDALVALPDGIFYKGEDRAPVAAIIEQHHLEAFLHAGVPHALTADARSLVADE